LAVVGLQRQTLTRSARFACLLPRSSAHLVRHGDRLAEMGNRLLECGAAKGLVARLAPPFDRKIVEARLGEVMRDRLGFGRCAFTQDFGRTGMQRLAATLKQAVIGRVLDQCALEAVVRLRSIALDEQNVGRSRRPISALIPAFRLACQPSGRQIDSSGSCALSFDPDIGTSTT
jgi:hypothetical protein